MEKKTVGQKVKGHFKKHKVKYVVGGTCAVVGVGVYLGNKGIINVQLVNTGEVTQVRNIDKSVKILTKKGHPGNKILCDQTKKLYNSQSEAASEIGINPTYLSEHMNGKKDTVQGYTFARMFPEDS